MSPPLLLKGFSPVDASASSYHHVHSFMHLAKLCFIREPSSDFSIGVEAALLTATSSPNIITLIPPRFKLSSIVQTTIWHIMYFTYLLYSLLISQTMVGIPWRNRLSPLPWIEHHPTRKEAFNKYLLKMNEQLNGWMNESVKINVVLFKVSKTTM